ncbi:MAG: RNA polymerase factor sigma-54 [Gammaproteobacteria bacterium]|nr:RNA polymerase factor sigma-54 [Gammaproteobacteria bacterium]
MTGHKQGFQLKQSQSLAVTPQMQQSLKILQCNRIELESEISTMLSENIMLEQISSDDFIYESNINDEHDVVQEPSYEDIPEIPDTDFEWDQIYDDKDDYQRSQNHDTVDGFQQDWISDTTSFDELIAENIYLSPLDTHEQQIAFTLLDYLDENYFLALPIPLLAKKISTNTETLKHIVGIIKHFEPAGIASQNIQECMLAQLHCTDTFNDAVGDANDILTSYFSHIGKNNALIMRRLGLNEDNFNAAMKIIRSLSPYPRNDDTNIGNIIRPDVYVHEKMGMFYASLNKDTRFDIAINKEYADLVQQCNGDEKNFMSAQLQNAKFFIRALDQRNQTVLRVSNAIIMQQQGYFTLGDKAIIPLLMKDVAEILNLAESTISRTVSGKYMSFNHQLIELRHFFSSDLSDTNTENNDGDIARSATAVKALIKEMIDNEPPQKPLSDSQIEKMIQAQGINIARRTVAKYRESLGILATSKRKRKI